MTPQLTKPKGANLYYRTKATGGYSPSILGNNSRGQRDPLLNTLPNCVGWAIGRFNEIGGYGACRYLASTNAKNFVCMAKAQGLTVTQQPTLGGIMVWGHDSKAGHVAVVEKIISPKAVVTSESEWNAQVFATYTHTIGDGNWREGCYWMSRQPDYIYLGCIKNPAVPDEEADEVITSRKLKNKDTGVIVTVKGILKDGQNYIRLADLAEMGVLAVSYDAKNNIAEVGRVKG